MTFMVSFGSWGGFYWHKGFGARLCLGWVALTWIPADIDDWLAAATAELERLQGIERAALNDQTPEQAAKRFRQMAREFVLHKDRAALFDIADTLDVNNIESRVYKDENNE